MISIIIGIGFIVAVVILIWNMLADLTNLHEQFTAPFVPESALSTPQLSANDKYYGYSDVSMYDCALNGDCIVPYQSSTSTLNAFGVSFGAFKYPDGKLTPSTKLKCVGKDGQSNVLTDEKCFTIPQPWTITNDISATTKWSITDI